MIALGLNLWQLQAAAFGGVTPSNWILATGFWNDSGVWDDTKLWID